MGLLGDFFAGLDNKKRVAASNLRGLLGDPAGHAGLLGRGIIEELAAMSRANLENADSSLSVMPQVRAQANEAALPNMVNLLGATVWHGSPHKFDKFDASKAGKHGGTSFGLGHNLSADRTHAAAYRGDNGSIYKVDLADESLPNFLSWESVAPKEIVGKLPPIDKTKPIPFGGGATVEKAKNGWLLKVGDTAFPLRESEFNRMFGDANTGEQVYRKLVAALGSEDAASAWLRKNGVAGIVNNTERGATNYSVFPGNEDLLKILERQ